MDIIKTYNPSNANITEEELSAMKDLSDEQIEQLAKAYPNQPTGNAYLEYYMKGEKEIDQRYPLGTWANLHNLRKLGRKDILPYRFRKNYRAPRPVPVDLQPKTAQRTVDLSKEEVAKAEGLKQPHIVTEEDLKANPGLKDHAKVGDEINIPSKEEINNTPANPELEAAQKELQQAIDDNAHHMTIKKLQSKVDALKGNNEGTKAGNGA